MNYDDWKLMTPEEDLGFDDDYCDECEMLKDDCSCWDESDEVELRIDSERDDF